jgi:hypothetical protein
VGGANDLSRESVRFGEQRVHGVGLVLEQKQTKETKIRKANLQKSPGVNPVRGRRRARTRTG